MTDIRYSRLELLNGIGGEGLTRIRQGKVIVIGCGALGSMCAMYLAASGVGTIAIADFDTIDISNLQRQLFFDEETLGKHKSAILAKRMRQINSEINVIEIKNVINESLARSLFPDYDFVIDGSDNPATKQMTAKICEEMGKPYCIGGVKEYSGQAMSWKPGKTGYVDLFGEVKQCNDFMPCSFAGVLGPAAGITASTQAAEAIKYLTGKGEMLYDRLFSFDLFNCSANIFGF